MSARFCHLQSFLESALELGLTRRRDSLATCMNDLGVILTQVIEGFYQYVKGVIVCSDPSVVVPVIDRQYLQCSNHALSYCLPLATLS